MTAETRTRDCLDPPLGVVLAEAVVEKEVCEGVVEVGPETHQAVRLVRIRDLPETLEAFKGTASEDYKLSGILMYKNMRKNTLDTFCTSCMIVHWIAQRNKIILDADFYKKKEAR